MEKLLQLLIAFFSQNTSIPEEVQATDQGAAREKSYLYELPVEPYNAVSFNFYGQMFARYLKDFSLMHLHIVVRNRDAAVAYTMIQDLFDFIVSLSSPENDGIQEIGGHYFMFDIRNGPYRLLPDEHQNCLWGLSVPVKCKTATGGTYA